MEEFDVVVRGGCEGVPEVKEIVRAKDLLKANQIVFDEHGQCYVALPKENKEKGGV